MNETTPSSLGNVITIDDERIKNHLDRVSGGDPERTAGCQGGPVVQCAALRAQRSTPGYPGRPLRTQVADQGWRGMAEDTEPSSADIRDRQHHIIDSTFSSNALAQLPSAVLG